MMPTVGGTITRSLHRLLGTLCAGVLGYLAISIALLVQTYVWRELLLIAMTGTASIRFPFAHSSYFRGFCSDGFP